MKKITIFIACTILSISCSADSIPFPFSDRGWEKEVNSVLAEQWRTVDKIKLYDSTLDMVENKYGKNTRYKEGGENYSPQLLCYFANNNYVIVFQSGPLGGWSKVTGILIAKKENYKNKNCSGNIKLGKSPGIYSLAIGNEESDVINFLGKPNIKANNFMAYRFQYKSLSKKKNKEVPVYITSGIEVGLKENKVTWIRVYWQEST